MKRFLRIYTDGFKNISGLGKKLWIIVFIKLFIMFIVLKIFFFPNFLNTNFKNDKERSNHVINNLIQQNK
jgi:hypothetical protein